MRRAVPASVPPARLPRAQTFVPKMIAKIRASKDVYHNILGTIDTPEKFNARRLHMAESVDANERDEFARMPELS